MDAEPQLVALIEQYGHAEVWFAAVESLGHPPTWGLGMESLLVVSQFLIDRSSHKKG